MDEESLHLLLVDSVDEATVQLPQSWLIPHTVIMPQRGNSLYFTMVDIRFPTYHLTALPDWPRRCYYGGSLCIIHIHAHLISTITWSHLVLGTIVDGFKFALRVIWRQVRLHTPSP